MKKLFIIMLFVCMTQMQFGQSNDSTFFKGHIITYSDTFDCFINYKTLVRDKIIIKKQYNEDKEIGINRETITYMHFRSFEFERIKYKENNHLFEKEADGFITLYSDYMEPSMPGNSFTGTIMDEYLPYREFYIKHQDNIYKLKRSNYMKLLPEMFCRDSLVIARLNDITFGMLQDELTELVKTYNNNPQNHPDSNNTDCYEIEKERMARAGAFISLAGNYSIDYINDDSDDIKNAHGGFGIDAGISFYYQTSHKSRLILNVAYYTNNINITYNTADLSEQIDTDVIDGSIKMKHLAITPCIEFFGDNYFWGLGIRIGVINEITVDYSYSANNIDNDFGFINQNYSSTGLKIYYGRPFKIFNPYISLEKPFMLPVTSDKQIHFENEQFDVGVGMFVVQLGLKVMVD